MGGAKPAECSAPVWDSIPSDLRSRRQWLLWFWESRGGRWTKPPRQPNGSPAKTDDEATWLSFEGAQTAFETSRGHKFDGVGFVLTNNDQFCGFDFDGCLDGQLKITDPNIADYVERLNSYTEVSPSLTGLRVIVRAQLPPGRRKKGNIEFYDRGRYLTITGNVWGALKPLAARQAEVLAIHAAIFGNNGNRTNGNDNHRVLTEKDIAEALTFVGDADDRDRWLRVGMALHSHLSEAGRPLWNTWSQQSSKYNERDQEKTWKRFKAGGGVTIASLIDVALEGGWPGTPRAAADAHHHEPGNSQQNTAGEPAGPESSLEKARAYLSEHDSEANTNHNNAKIIYSSEYLAAATTLYDEDPLEYRNLESKLKNRGYRIADFQRKRRESRDKHKSADKGQPHQSAHQHNQTQATTCLQPDHFTPKGYTASHRSRLHCYVVLPSNRLVTLPASRHTHPALFELARLAWWESRFPSVRGVNWQAAASWLMELSAAQGVFDPSEARRGIGLWKDEGRLLFHKGDELIDADTHRRIPLSQLKSAFVYEPRKEVKIDLDDYASDDDAERLIQVLKGFSWKNPLAPKLLAGWVAVAPLSAALEFRPTSWITAGDEVGKSTILEKIIIPTLGGPGPFTIVPSGSQTTEAFLRQTVDCDCKTVVFDEADTPNTDSKGRGGNMPAILNYVRGSNSAGGPGKGGSDGVPVNYSGKPMFLIASITLPLSQAADVGRTVVFELRRPPATPEAATAYAELCQTISQHFTPRFGHRFIARAIRHARTTLGNIVLYQKALMTEGIGARSADRIATMLGGVRSLTKNATILITDQEAIDNIKECEFGDFVDKDYSHSRDEFRFWDHLISHRIRVATPAGTTDYTAGELIEQARDQVMPIAQEKTEALPATDSNTKTAHSMWPTQNKPLRSCSKEHRGVITLGST